MLNLKAGYYVGEPTYHGSSMSDMFSAGAGLVNCLTAVHLYLRMLNDTLGLSRRSRPYIFSMSCEKSVLESVSTLP